jgi:hypothetical protein
MGIAKKAKATRRTTRPARTRTARVPLRPATRQERSDGGDAFIPDPGEGPAHTDDDLAELLAEDFIEAATRGNEVLEDDLDRPLADELGGPFVVTDPRDELADGVDESNPDDAVVEPLPRANAGLVLRPREETLDDELRALNDEGDDLSTDEDAELNVEGGPVATRPRP